MRLIIAERYNFWHTTCNYMHDFEMSWVLMEHRIQKTAILENRIGFQYFPDTKHYRKKDLQDWLPILKKIDVKWLLLKSPLNRGIPEGFISPLANENINVIIDFEASYKKRISWDDLELLLQGYGRWGAKFAILDRNPNLKSSWKSKDWLNPNLVEFHTAQFIRFAKLCLKNNIRPIYSPLFPGGDYWDLSFFSRSMQVISEQSSRLVRSNFLIAAYAWHFGKHLDLDENHALNLTLKLNQHPKRMVVSNSQFRNYANYAEIAANFFESTPPIILLDCGVHSMGHEQDISQDADEIKIRRSIFQLLKSENTYNSDGHQIIKSIRPEIAAGIFTQLSSASDSNSLNWFDKYQTPSISAQSIFSEAFLKEYREGSDNESGQKFIDSKFKFDRYILLHEHYQPLADNFIRKLHPYLNKYKPVIGFSKEDAADSAYVIYISPSRKTSKKDIGWIRSKGNLLKVIQPKDIDALIKEQIPA